MPIYASPEQFMRDRSEYARKGIARGRSVVVTTYAGGVLFVAENHSPSLHKVSEIYDRLGFAAVGRYNEFENLRTAGHPAGGRARLLLRPARRHRPLAGERLRADVGLDLLRAPEAVRGGLCVAEVAENGGADQLYLIAYDGSIVDETTFVVMGGTTEPVITSLKSSFRAGWSLEEALRAAVEALGSAGDNAPRTITGAQLEVAILDRRRRGRTFRRIVGSELDLLLEPVPPSRWSSCLPSRPQPADRSAIDGGADPDATVDDQPRRLLSRRRALTPE